MAQDDDPQLWTHREHGACRCLGCDMFARLKARMQETFVRREEAAILGVLGALNAVPRTSE